MKRVNLKLLLTVIIVVVTTTVGLYFLRRFQVRRNAGSLAKQARALLEEGKAGEALVLLTRYVGLRPEDNEVFAEYARLVLAQAESPDAARGDLARAYNTLEAAVRRNPDNARLRARLAKFQVRIGRYGDAREHIAVLQERTATGQPASPPDAEPWTAGGKTDDEDPASPENLQLLLARSWLGTGEFLKAAKLAADLVGFDVDAKTFDIENPKRGPTNAYIVLAAIFQEKMREPKTARAVLTHLVTVDEQDSLAWASLARLCQQQGDLKEARRAIAKAAELAPDDEEAVFTQFELALAERDLESAEKIASHAIELFPNGERGYRGLAAVRMQQNRLSDAEQVLRDGVASMPTRASLLLMLTEVLLQQNNLDDADDTIARLKELFGQSNPTVGLFESRVMIARQQWLRAKQLLEQVRPLAAGNDELTRQVDLYLGQCFEQLGEFDAQLEANRRVLTLNPTSLAARVGEASALAAAGKPQEALEEFEKIAAAVPAEALPSIPQVWLPLLQLRIDSQAKLPAESRDWSRVDGLVDMLQQAPQVTATQIALIRSEVLARKGELEAAVDLLERAVEADPSEAQCWSALVTLVMRTKGAMAAREVLAKVPRELADKPNMLILEAQIALFAGGDAAREKFKDIADRASRLPSELECRVLTTLAPMYTSIGDRATARQLWKTAAEKQPEDLRPRVALFDSASESGDLDEAREAAAAIAKVAGRTSAQARVAEAGVNIMSVRKALAVRHRDDEPMPKTTDEERRQLDAARNLLIEAENDRPGWTRIPSLLAEIDGLKGDVPRAIEHLKEAVTIGPTNPALVKQLVSLLYASNRIDEARQALAMLGNEGVQGMERVSAEMEMRSGKFEEAVALAERSVAADSRNASELLWLGQLLDQSGRKERAGETIERAVELAPERPETWLTLLSHQLNLGKRRSAEKTLERAGESLAEPQRSLALAQGNEMLGRLDDAERFFRDAAAAAPENLDIKRGLASFLIRCGRIDPARSTLLDIMDAKSSGLNAASTRVWARRALAELIAERANYRTLQEAIALLEKNVGEDGKLGPDDVQQQIKLLSGRPEPACWRQALQLLEKLGKTQPLSMGQRLQIAQLMEKTGRWDEARNSMVSIVAAPNTPPAFVGLLVEKLIDHDELPAARTWFRRLAASHPDAPVTVGLQAKLAVAEKNRDLAIEAARKLMPTADVSPEQGSELAAVSKLYEDLDFDKAADKVLEKWAAVSVDGVVARVEFLGRQNRGDEALDLLDKARDRLPLERIMQIGVQVVRDQEDPARTAARLEEWLDKARREDPDSVVLALLLAELRDIVGRTEEAIAIQREILARKDVPPIQAAITANNLAFHLARPDSIAEARTLIEKAIDELGPHPDLLDTRGVVRLVAGDVAKAVEDFQEAVCEPSPVKFLHLAFAQLENGNKDAARKSLEKARRRGLEPAILSQEDKNRLGKLEAAFGDAPEA